MTALLYPLMATYGTVLVAELIGDRSLYTIGLLSTRFGTLAVLCGAIPAFAVKALAAVAFGGLLRGLPRAAIAGVSAAAFGLAALLIWRREDEREPAGLGVSTVRGGVAAFSSVLLSEWADAGQLATAAMAGRFSGGIVWLAATLALSTKAIVASSVGARTAARIPPRRLRLLSAGLFVFMGVLALIRAD